MARRTSQIQGRILVAEDEPMVLKQVPRVLESRGHTVITARDGQEAVEAYLASNGDIDVLLFDAVMPRLDGWQAYEQIRAKRPSIPVLFSSGYAAALPTDCDSETVILAKSYRPEVLLDTVDDVLRRKLESA